MAFEVVHGQEVAGSTTPPYNQQDDDEDQDELRLAEEGS